MARTIEELRKSLKVRVINKVEGDKINSIKGVMVRVSRNGIVIFENFKEGLISSKRKEIEKEFRVRINAGELDQAIKDWRVIGVKNGQIKKVEKKVEVPEVKLEESK